MRKKLFVKTSFILALNQCNHSIVRFDDDVWLECKILDMDRMGWHSVIDAYSLLAYIFRMDFHSWANDDDGCDDDKMVQNYCCRPNMAAKWYEVTCVMDFGQLNDSATVSTKMLYLLLNCNWFEPHLIPCLQTHSLVLIILCLECLNVILNKPFPVIVVWFCRFRFCRFFSWAVCSVDCILFSSSADLKRNRKIFIYHLVIFHRKFPRKYSKDRCLMFIARNSNIYFLSVKLCGKCKQIIRSNGFGLSILSMGC